MARDLDPELAEISRGTLAHYSGRAEPFWEGTRDHDVSQNLDALLGDKEAVSDEVREAIAERAESMGLSVSSAGLRDIILPGEMKSILNQVIEAEKQAQANLIRRREETSAARSQANTAKLLAENPVLARMKELEVLQDILSNAKATFVLGQGAAIDQVSRLIGNGSPNGES